MTIHALDRFMAGAMTLFGLWLVQSGMQLGFMKGYVPGAGLFPAILGCGIAALSLINLIRAFAGFEKLSPGMPRKELLQALAIILILLGAVILTTWLGLTLATFIAMIMVGAVLQLKKSLRFGMKLFLVSLVTAIACRLLFQEALSVPVPVGILGF